MKRALVLAALVACGGDDGDTTPPADERTFDQCDGDPASFVRASFVALIGQRPAGTAEVQQLVALYEQTAAAGRNPEHAIARELMARPAFAERWIDVIMDALRVQRLDIQSEHTCWDAALRPAVTPALALAVRDRPATSTGDGAPWAMIDLARSAIALDDMTPIYRAQLFSLASHPLPAANVPAIEAELARRADFGKTFDAGYLHRDTVCLVCHTSETSVTDSDDAVNDRHWPVPGAPERAIYGVAMGISAERAHAVFRVDGFVGAGELRPWGWAASCGQFAPPAAIADDPAGVDGKLGNIVGRRATVFDLEAALARGFAGLRTGGPPMGPIADPDVALAWLVTLAITETVWKQVIGTPLTIANYFPRNQAASAQLYELASKLVSSGFSLKALLLAIVTSDYFNRIPPEGACGPSPYTYPAVFDPWVPANGPGEAVTPIDARTLVSIAHAALEWGPAPRASRFPEHGELPVEEVPFQRAVGMFLRSSEPGFRGLDFQARLAWEDRYGRCAKPAWVMIDFVDRLVASGSAHPTATAADLVAALKDRLIGEPAIDRAGAEGAALAAIVGPLDAPASAVTPDALRRVCGALVETPQFTLQGIPGRGGDVPLLAP